MLIAKYILVALCVFCISCSTGQKTTDQKDCQPVTSDEFLRHPLNIDLNIKDFKQNYGEDFNLRKFSRNLNNRKSALDTIYQFISGENAFIFYTGGNNNEESFLTLKIADDRIQLENCIRVGMERNRLEEFLSDFPESSADTVKIDNDNRQGVFIFKESQLKKLHINNFYK